MADDMEDTPPPLPASLPPSMETNYTGQKRSASQKFLMLQAQLSSSKSMYLGGAPKKAVPPPVRPKPSVKLKQHAVDIDEVDSGAVSKKPPVEDKKLVHRTLERPKRRGIRTPSKGSLYGTFPRSVTSMSELSRSFQADEQSDFDEPPPLPSTAPPPSIGDASDLSLPSNVASYSPNDDNVFAPDMSASPDLDELSSDNELPPPLPLIEPPGTVRNGMLTSSHEPAQPTKIQPSDKPPLASESLSISKVLPHTMLTNDNFTTEPPLPLLHSSISTKLPSSLDKSSPQFTDKQQLHNLPESPPYDVPPPPLPSSQPPTQYKQDIESIRSTIPYELHASKSSHEGMHKEKEQAILSDSFESSTSPYLASISSGFSGSIRQQEKPSSPLMTSSYWSSSMHSSSLRSSPMMDSHNQSFDGKSDYSLNSSNASLVKVSSTNARINDAPVHDAKPTTDNKPTSSVSKFRERIARLKQKREGIMPSPAMSVQSEMMALNSRVTSPLQSSYSATLLDSSDVTFSKPYTDYTNSISPPLISSEELLTPTQSSPVSHPTTNFANNPPVLSSDVKRVQPFTVKKISSSRISNNSITPTQSSPAGIADDSTGAKIITSVDLHSESAFSKPWSSNITDNAIVMSGLPTDVSGSNSVVNHSDDDEDDSDATPPPLPPSLPPDAFESDSFFDQADIISDDIPPPDLPSIPPPSVPATTNIVEDEVLDSGIPPLPTSPIPFEPSSNEQPFIESLPIEPPKNFLQTPPEIANTDISVSTEFRTAEMVLDKMKQAPDHKTGLQLDVCKRSSPKTVRPISHYNTRGVESLSQTPAGTGSSRHSIHLQYDLEPENNKSNVLPMFVSQQLVTQHHDDEPLDSRTQKSSKKSSKLKFPWQKRLTHDRSHSMSEERQKRKSKKSSREGIDIRHSSADIKQDVTDSSVILRNRNVNRLRGTNEPVTSASVGDLRRPITVSIDSFSASHMELNKGGLEPSKPPKDELDEKTSPNQQQALKVGESTISLPHMTTPELYRRLCEPSNSSLLESVMKDIPLFNANTTAAEETMEQTPVEDQSKGDSTLADQQKELVINPEALLDQKEESFTADMEANQSPVRNSEECLSSNLSDSLHDDVTVDSFGSPPSPVCSIQSDQGWSSSAADTPNFHDRRWRETALGSINTLTSNDSLRDLLRQRVTIGDWNVDHVVHWLESVGLSSVVPVFQQYSIDGAKLKSLSDTKLGELELK